MNPARNHFAEKVHGKGNYVKDFVGKFPSLLVVVRLY